MPLPNFTIAIEKSGNIKNLRSRVFFLTLMVVLALLALFWLPKIRIGSKDMRRVNLLSDVQRRDADGNIIAELTADSLMGTIEIAPEEPETADALGTAFDQIEDEEETADISTAENQLAETENPKDKESKPQTENQPESQTQASSDTTVSTARAVASVNEGDTAAYHPADIKPIDYSSVSTGEVPDIEDFGCTMAHFRAALAQAGSRPVRIAFFGDSFIEGDILTSDLREMLQSAYGGKGVGWLDISCVSERFRLTAKTNCSGWECHHANDKSGHKGALQGLNGGYFISKGNASFNVTTNKGHAATADKATIFFVPGDISFKGRVNGSEAQPVVSASNGAMGTAEFQAANIGKFAFDTAGSGRVFGVALDSSNGVCLDNYSMRGSNGWYTANTADDVLAAYARLRPYDLFIFEYGLNVANKKQTDYSNYTRQFKKVIRKIKAHFPGASILILGSGDRDERSADGLVTMKGVKELMAAQRQMAADEGVAFWNLFLAMGGDGSIGRMQQKGQANLDYTHINAAGGKVVAKSLFEALTR